MLNYTDMDRKISEARATGLVERVHARIEAERELYDRLGDLTGPDCRPSPSSSS